MSKRKLLSVTVAIALTLTTSTVAFADPLSDQLQQRQNKLQQDKNALSQVQKQKEDLQENIEHMDVQIESLMTQIDGTKKQIDKTQLEIKDAEKNIQKAEEDIKDEQALFNKRMRVMYMNGTDGYLEVLLESDGLGDFLSKVETIKSIMDLDKKIVSDLKAKKKEITDKKDALSAQNSKLLALKADNEQKLVKLNENKTSQAKLIADLKAKEKLLASTVDSSKALVEQTKKQIAAMIASVPKNNPSRGSAPVSSNAIVAYASNFLGKPYQWGGNGPERFDCSGFVKYVFAHFGISLPRVAEDQARVGTQVSRDDLQPGDVVYFGKGYIHHIGIYVGNDCFIHAPQTGDVIKISQLSRTDYAGATRMQ